MRGKITLALAAALTAIGGVRLLYLWLFAADWKGWMVTGAGCMFTVGVAWLLQRPSKGPAPKK
jgi:hypothetical protein